VFKTAVVSSGDAAIKHKTTICQVNVKFFHMAYKAMLFGTSPAGPRVWNALPSHLWWDINYKPFKHALKGHNYI